jgi:hypothetical protein
LHDAIAGERLGIPSVGIMTDRFVRSAEVMGELNGLPNYPFAVIGHPIANNTAEVILQKAEIAAERIVFLLTKRDD